MASIKQIQVNNTTYDINAINSDNIRGEIWYATCDTAAGTTTKVATIQGDASAFSLTTGTVVFVNFTYANSSSSFTSLKLNVNNTGDYKIKYCRASTTEMSASSNLLAAGQIIKGTNIFMYDGTNWLLLSTNTDNYVHQANTTTSSNYRVLFSNGANDSGETAQTRKSTNLQFNPSTAELKVGNGTSTGSISANTLTVGTSVQTPSVLAPTTSGGSTYGAGTNGQVLTSNGTSTYWADAQSGFSNIGELETQVGDYPAYIFNKEFDDGVDIHYNYAGSLGCRWSAVSKTTSGDYTLVTFTINNETDYTNLDFSNFAVDDRISCKAGYSWTFCGTVSSLTTTTLTLQVVTADIPTAGVDGVTTTWAPENYINSVDGYFWCPDKPNAGYWPIGEGAMTIGLDNKSNETGAFSAGKNNIADGKYSVAVGRDNEVGYASIASGKSNKAYGYYSLTHGHSNEVYGGWGMASGNKNKTYRLYDFATGSENKIYTNAGSALGSKNTLGSSTTKDIANNSTIMGQNNTLVKGVGSIVGGNSNTVGTTTYGSGQSLVIGSTNTVASTANSHYAIVSGTGNTVNGASQIVSGSSNVVSNSTNIVNGSSNTVSGLQNIVDGGSNTVASSKNLVVGNGNTVNANNSSNAFGAIIGGSGNTSTNHYVTINGLNNSVTHTGSSAFGSNLVSGRSYQLNVGVYNAANSSALFTVGSGSSTSARKNILAALSNGDLVVAGNITSNGKDVLTKPIPLYIVSGDDDDFYVADSNGTIYTQGELYSLYEAGNTFELIDNEPAFSDYSGFTYPLSAIEIIDQSSRTLTTPWITTCAYDGNVDFWYFEIDIVSNSSENTHLYQTSAEQHNVPAGGSQGQVLTKNSSTNYDVSWQTPASEMLLYLYYDSEEDETYAVDENGTPYTQQQIYNLYVGGKAFKIKENNYNYWDGITYPLSVIEDVSNDYGNPAYEFATPFVMQTPYDGSTAPFYWMFLIDSTSTDRVYAYRNDGLSPISQQNINNANANYRVLLSNSASDTSERSSRVNKTPYLYFNPNTKALYVNSYRVQTCINSIGAPTTSTYGYTGQTYIDSTNNVVYMCLGYSSGSYNWIRLTYATAETQTG